MYNQIKSSRELNNKSKCLEKKGGLLTVTTRV